MRLIDADALKERFQSLAYDDWNQGVCTSWADAYRECADMVDDMPTIEPERKKGKWIGKHEMGIFSNPDSITYRCSECNHPIYTLYGTPKCSNYCPDCGAKMEEGEQDD